MTDPVPYFEKIKQKLADENLKKEFLNFKRDVLFDFTDIGKQYTLRFANGNVEIIAGKFVQPQVEITTNKEEMQDLLKLQKLM